MIDGGIAQHNSLTVRERDVLQLLDQGLSDREIAQRLFLTPGTVKWYNRQIYGKLAVSTRTQALAKARAANLLAPDSPAVASSSSTAVPSHTLPAQLTRLVGRETEIATLGRLLRSHRLLTLTGTGGTGKTRLALAVAQAAQPEFPDGIHFLPLAPVPDPAAVPHTLGAALDVPEVPHEPYLATIARALRAQRTLLVLDNFEHLLVAAPALAELLAATPSLHLLVTSRVALRLYGEQEYAVQPLSLPADPALASGDDPECFESVALFAQAARAVRLDFALTPANAATVIAICRRLDGLPLAIELAAAQLRWLTPEAVLSRLGNRLAVLTGGARDRHPRQQTLRQTLDWSYQLLDPAQQRLFAWLAVFAGGWTLAAATAVYNAGAMPGGIEQLGALVEHSLVRQWPGANGEPRFGLLETIREYAWEQLAARGESDAARARHAAYYTALARQGDAELRGEQQLRWLSLLETEHDNFRAVLHWSAAGTAAELGLQLADALSFCWLLHGHLVEGLRLAEQLLTVGVAVPRTLRARVLVNAGFLAYQQADYRRSAACAAEALALAEAGDDRPTVAWARLCLGMCQTRPALPGDDLGPARAHFDACLSYFRAVGDRWGQARTINALGVAAVRVGDLATAERRYQEALALFRELANPWGLAKSLLNLGELAQARGDLDLAQDRYREALHLSHQLDDRCVVANLLGNLGQLCARRADPIRAATLFGAAEMLHESVGIALPPSEQPEHHRQAASARSRLGERAFAAAWAVGHAMTGEQAVDYALAAPPVAAAAVGA